MQGATHYADLAGGRVWLDLSKRHSYRINHGDGWRQEEGWPAIKTGKVKPISKAMELREVHPELPKSRTLTDLLPVRA